MAHDDISNSSNLPPDSQPNAATGQDNVWIQWQMIHDNPCGMALVDAQHPDMPIIYVNKAFEHNTGYSIDEVIGKNPRILQGTDRHQAGRTVIRGALQRKESCIVVMRNYRKDGTMFWNEVRISPLRDQNGTVTHFLGVHNDITIRKEAELALEQSEIRYHQIFNSQSAIKLMIDPSTGHIMDANLAATAFYGYTHEQLTTMRIQDINHLSDAELFQSMQLTSTREQTHFEMTHRLASGEIRDVDVFSSLIDTRERQFIYEIIVDMTAKREAERRYRSLFEQSNDGVMIVDLTGHYLDANQRAADMLGYTIAELKTLSFHDIIVPEQLAISTDQFQQMRACNYQKLYENIVQRKDGARLFIEMNVETICDINGQPLYIQAIARDITERKQLEQKLLDQQEQLRTVVNNVPIMLSIFDATGRVEFTNQYWLDHLGWTIDEINGAQEPLDILFSGLEDRRKAVEYMHAASPEWREFEIASRSGEQLTSAWMNIRLSDGRTIGIGQDVTGRKRAQQREIELMLERGRKRMLAQFIQNAAHEFRTPLTIISSGAHLMSRSNDPEYHHLKGEQIEGQIKRITDLLDTLLIMAKLESPDAAAAAMPVHLDTLLETAGDRMRFRYGDHPVLHLTLPPDLPTMVGSEQHLADALHRLLDNAYRFTPPEGTISVTAQVIEHQISVAIRDNGAGIAEKDLPHIFETFWRGDEAHTTPGFGLGLAIARQIIEQYGGTITVTSQPGQGACFQIMLPASKGV